MLFYHLFALYNEFALLSEVEFDKKVRNVLETVFPTENSHQGREFEKLQPFRDSVRNLRTMSGRSDGKY